MFQRLLIDRMEHRILVGTLAFLGIMVLVGWIAINEGGRMQTFDRQFTARSVERGAGLFASNCSTCHGVDGRGLGGRAPALNSPYLFGHDFLAEYNGQISLLEAELIRADTTEERKTEINTKLEELKAQKGTAAEQIRTALQNAAIPGMYDPEHPSRLENLKWQGGLHNFVYTTLVHGRPVSAGYWDNPMASWSQLGGGPLRSDQLEDLTQYILNWDKGDNWTLDDLYAVKQFQVNPCDPSQPTCGSGGGVETVGTDVPTIVANLATVTGDPQRGQTLYNGALGCAGCHLAGQVAPATEGTWTRVVNERLAATGAATGEEYIAHSIVLPNDYIVSGFTPGVMPQNFGDRLPLQDLADLVAYLKSQDQ